jgi:uncharacterized protein YkwD
MKTLIIFLMLYSSLYCFSQNLRTAEEVKYFNKEFIRLLNIERKKLNLDTLIESDKLNKSSMNWSRECIIRTKFEHSDLRNIDINAECLDLGISNLPVEDAVQVVIESFKSSESHWELLMSNDYKYVGASEYVKQTYMTISIGSIHTREFRTHSVTTVHLK